MARHRHTSGTFGDSAAAFGVCSRALEHLNPISRYQVAQNLFSMAQLDLELAKQALAIQRQAEGAKHEAVETPELPVAETDGEDGQNATVDGFNGGSVSEEGLPPVIDHGEA